VEALETEASSVEAYARNLSERIFPEAWKSMKSWEIVPAVAAECWRVPFFAKLSDRFKKLNAFWSL